MIGVAPVPPPPMPVVMKIKSAPLSEVSRVADLLDLEPLITFATAIILLHEPVSAATVAGGVIVLASVAVAQYAPTASHRATAG